jgi:hypothetical protein
LLLSERLCPARRSPLYGFGPGLPFSPCLGKGV